MSECEIRGKRKEGENTIEREEKKRRRRVQRKYKKVTEVKALRGLMVVRGGKNGGEKKRGN